MQSKQPRATDWILPARREAAGGGGPCLQPNPTPEHNTLISYPILSITLTPALTLILTLTLTLIQP